MDSAAERRVLVVAATNRQGAIDPALLRPGRLDLQLEVGPPDLEARAEFFRAELARRPAEDLDPIALAQAVDGATFSQIRRMMEVAARSALSENKLISSPHLLSAFHEVLPCTNP